MRCWFGSDQNDSCACETRGADFLSPTPTEIVLMRKLERERHAGSIGHVNVIVDGIRHRWTSQAWDVT